MSRIIISFTSYPARIKTVDKVLDSIIEQTILPDKIILFLSSQQFLGYEQFPDFSIYKEYGFKIYWYEEDLGPHKKYYYAMQKYPDDIVITIDDDICYRNTMIEELLIYHKKYPRAVITRRAHLITWMQEGSIAPYEKWYKETLRYIGIPRMDLVSTGVSGVLYPPHIFNSEIFNKKIFMEKAPFADDLWLKVMELYSGIPVVLTKYFFDDPGLENYSENGLYRNQNSRDRNDVQLHSLLETYGDSYGNENNLIKKLSMSGKLMFVDLEKEKKKDVMFLSNDIMQILNDFFKIVDDQETVLVYGAGKVAERIYSFFEKTNRLKKISAFIVRNVKENKKEFGKINVKDYRDYVYSSEKILIGLCEKKQEEIYKELIKIEIDKERIIRLSPLINKLIALI